MATPRPARIATWLAVVAALVFMMVVIGGITRLTESGLSITEWKPISGTLPPLTDAAWQAEFDAYKQIPEYTQINAGMTLAQFKGIWFWEYVHRLLGRVIGLAFALPLIWFWARGAIPAGYKPRLLALLALGGFQGAIGWWMVMSGLSERTDVSHIRLAVHLLTALTILGGLTWTIRDLRALARDPQARPARLTALAGGVLAILFVQLLYGAFVAGMDAGQVAGDWPLMQGQFFPAGVEWVGPATLVDDPYLVHFIHRWWAWIAAAALILLARAAKSSGDRPVAIGIHVALGTQILLGIATVMTGVAIWLAVLHQAVGALLVITTAAGAWAAGRASRSGARAGQAAMPGTARMAG